jgi:cation transport regulator ChaB
VCTRWRKTKLQGVQEDFKCNFQKQEHKYTVEYLWQLKCDPKTMKIQGHAAKFRAVLRHVEESVPLEECLQTMLYYNGLPEAIKKKLSHKITTIVALDFLISAVQKGGDKMDRSINDSIKKLAAIFDGHAASGNGEEWRQNQYNNVYQPLAYFII